MARKLKYKKKISGSIKLLSGLHIGDSKETTEIGGIDTPVVRRKDKNREPYIPGSSLKGKIRCLLEQIEGAEAVGKAKNEINEVFGIADKNNTKASKLIFRDSYMIQDENYKLLELGEYTDMPFTEMKIENVIDRVTGKAKDGGIRNIERIPAGVSFNFEVIINCFEGGEISAETDFEISFNLLKRGLKALNNDYLGGSGSRGYGHVFIDVDNMKEEIIQL